VSVLGPGDRIAGRYRLLEELGGGGMGVVFRARDEEESRDVAVKILRRTNPEAVRRLQREARATRRLDPERVAEVYDAGETEAGEPFLVMEYVEGRTLRALLLAGALERAEVLQILREIATTLGQAHAAGLVHRDVKPDNVIVRADGRVVLLDFGIVKHIDLSGDAAQVTTLLTSEGAMIGTPAYLAPEQALGRDVAPAVDQFALAVTAFELLTGKLPWTATEVTRMLAQLLADRPPPASTLKEGLSKSFDAVLWRGLSKSPVDRFPSVEKFVEALEAAERGIVMASPASQTLDVPAPSALPLAPSGLSSMADASPTFDAPASTAVPLPKSRKSLGALAFVALVGVSVGGIFLARGRPSRVEGNASGAGAAHALGLSSHAALACPIFAVEGLPEIASQLGAAAASFACARAKWYLGGSDDRVVVPAALLDAPAQPGPSLPDLYDAPDARSRTLGVTKARGLASLDGTVTRRDQSWRLDLVVRAEDGREIARTEGEETPYLASAIRSATSRLWQTAPLAPEPIDPDVARWTAYPTIETGLMDLDLREVGARAEACARVGHEGAALGRSYFDFSERCHLGDGAIDAGALAVDRSSPSGLVTSVNAILTAASTNPFSEAEMRGLASEVESMRATESSHLGRASLDRLAGLLWSLVHDTDRAHTALLSAVADDPLFLNDWFQLQWLAGETGSSDAVKSLASVWFPQEP
jgi:predicted Ser/Thr protein kinase